MRISYRAVKETVMGSVLCCGQSSSVPADHHVVPLLNGPGRGLDSDRPSTGSVVQSAKPGAVRGNMCVWQFARGSGVHAVSVLCVLGVADQLLC